MIKPMLAVPMAKAIITNWHDWVAEEKYDGVRLLVEVTNRGVTAWTRRGANGKNVGGDTRDLPDHMVAAFATLPVGVYDGELVGGTTSTDVTRLELRKTLRFVVFDIVDIGAHSICSWPYEQRREYLEWLAARRPDSKGRSRGESVFKDGVIELSTAIKLTNQRDVEQFVKSVWKRGGEGAILKRKAGIYHPGKRSPD